MHTHEVLSVARALIDTPDTLQRGRWGSAEDGKFCAVGAIAAVACDTDYPFSEQTYDPRSVPAIAALRAAIGLTDDEYLPGAVDDMPHDDVMAAFDRAIAATNPPRYKIVYRAPGESPAAAFPSNHNLPSAVGGMTWAEAREAFSNAGWFNQMVYSVVPA